MEKRHNLTQRDVFQSLVGFGIVRVFPTSLHPSS
jgi:hypothetical protein